MPEPPEKIDRFKPAMPQIPGVGEHGCKSTPVPAAAPHRRRTILAGVLLAGSTTAIVGGWWLLHRAPPAGMPSAASAPLAEEAPPPARPAKEAAAPPTPVERADGSLEIASLEEFAKPWSSKKFTFRNRLTGANVPALAMHLPGGAFWAFALQAPFGRCDLELESSLPRLATEFGYRASHPMVVDRCNGTLYDPLNLGSLASGAWARGEVVQGPGIRPPIAIEVHPESGKLIATRME